MCKNNHKIKQGGEAWLKGTKRTRGKCRVFILIYCRLGLAINRWGERGRGTVLLVLCLRVHAAPGTEPGSPACKRCIQAVSPLQSTSWFLLLESLKTVESVYFISQYPKHLTVLNSIKKILEFCLTLCTDSSETVSIEKEKKKEKTHPALQKSWVFSSSFAWGHKTTAKPRVCSTEKGGHKHT